MSTYTVYIDFGGTSGEVDITSLIRAIIPTQRICTDSYRRATDQCSLTLRYDADLMASLSSVVGEVTVRILKDGEPFFFGRIPPTESFESAGASGGSDPDVSDLELEVTDFGNKLDREITADDEIAWENLPVCDPSAPWVSIVHRLFSLCGLTLNTTVAEPTVLRGFARDSGTVASALDTLLYEYGLVAYQRENGEWDLYRWIEESPEATETLDAENIMASLKVERVERESDAAKVVWYGLKEKAQALVYMADLPFGDDNQRSGYPVQPGLLWPEEANVEDTWFDYQDTSLAKTLSESGQRIVSNKDFTQILLTSNHTLDVHIDSGLAQSFTPVFQNKRAHLAYLNPTAGPLNIYYCDIYANVVYRAAENAVTKNAVLSPVKTNTYEAEFIHDAESASRLACAMADLLYGKSVWRYTFPMEDKLTLGAVATLTDPYSGLSTTVRIVERSYDPETDIYTYKAISIKAVVFTPSSSQMSIIPITPKTKEEDTSQQTQKISDDLYAYMNDTPPINNPTELALSYESNADGSVDILFSFKYVQGQSKADGFWFFYPDGLEAPTPINISTSAKTTISAQKNPIEVTYSGKLSAISTRYGGVGAVTKHYRFGIIAFGIRKSGTVPYENELGENEIVELPDWIDKTFESTTIAASEGDVTMSYEGASIVWRMNSTGAEKARIRYDALTDLLNVGQLAGLVQYRGSWVYDGTFPTGSSKLSNSNNGNIVVIPFSNGSRLIIFYNSSTQYVQESLRAEDGTYGAPINIINGVRISEGFDADILPDGRVIFYYIKDVDNGIYEMLRTTTGVWSSPTLKVEYSLFTQYLGKPRIIARPDGSCVLLYVAMTAHTVIYAVHASVRNSSGNITGIFNGYTDFSPDIRTIQKIEGCAYDNGDVLIIGHL